MQVRKVKVEGTITLRVGSVLVICDIPFPASLLTPKIKSSILQQLEKTLS
jgi:hypothetical protein